MPAYERLFGRYYERVQRIVRLRLGAKMRNHLESGDIVQETFIAAIQAFDNFEVREEAGLINWLAKIAERRITHAARDMGARKRDRACEVPLASIRASLISGELICEAVDAAVPDRLAQDAEQVEVVERALERLTHDQREAILLHAYAGATYETVAKELGRPSAEAARKLYKRAVIELAEILRRGRTARPE
ncbi:MAG: sigma-70 family RNA polymerase sigma factor [bacterium]|nr:sigma-70 family RNA polymerase sigma factor [bacterium]